MKFKELKEVIVSSETIELTGGMGEKPFYIGEIGKVGNSFDESRIVGIASFNGKIDSKIKILIRR